jgi:hypothetical protein
MEAIMSGSAIRTEIRGLDLCLDEGSLTLTTSGENVIPPIRLSPQDLERLAMEMAKAQLWEWNQMEELKSRAELRYRRYLGAWLVMCVAAFSAYLGYPSYYLCVLFALLSIFLWWRVGHVEQQARSEAETQRRAFVADWNYIRERLEESETTPASGSSSPAEME